MEVEDFTAEQKLKIREYFEDPAYPQPHGEVMAAQLLAAMIVSGKYELEEYPRLVEASIKLTKILVIRFNDQMSELRESRGDDNPKPQASEKESANSDPNSEAYDPIPF
jgi:hypothetical protein